MHNNLFLMIYICFIVLFIFNMLSSLGIWSFNQSLLSFFEESKQSPELYKYDVCNNNTFIHYFNFSFKLNLKIWYWYDQLILIKTSNLYLI